MGDVALSKGKQAVLARARLLTEFVWTPLGDVPAYNKKLDQKITLPAGVPLQGMLYSSTEPTDKFVCENISFETFRTVIQNPHSALYCKDIGGHNNSWACFGVVCNGLVRYALNIRRRFSTKRWLTVPGMRKVLDAGCYTAEQLELCDVLFAYGQGTNHVALITDIQRDETGAVVQIEISEASRPTCVRRQFSTAEYFEKYKVYSICRYDYIDEVPMPDEADVAFFEEHSVPTPTVAVDYGNKTNYRTGEDVVISAFAGGTVEISCGGQVLEQAQAPCRLVRQFPRGYYEVSMGSEKVEFCVTEPEISHCVKDGMLYLQADPRDSQSRIQHLEFRERAGQPRNVSFYSNSCAPLVSVEELTEEEKQTGKIVRKIPEEGENFKVYFKNPYGVWTHTMIKL